MKSTNTHKDIQNYYGKTLKNKDDLQTSACCTADAMPTELRAYLKNVHEDIQQTYYGCGTPIPDNLKGCTVLDLGCGTGQDAYILSQLVGENGRVIGIDMTEEQLQTARKYEAHHAEVFGYAAPNTDFRLGYIEDLHSVEDASIDVIVSNCVLNLSPNKDAVFTEINRVLKDGGELYFSDIFADQNIAEELRKDPILLGECLSGAMTIETFSQYFDSFEIIKSSPFEIHNEEIAAKIGHINFTSITISAHKGEPKKRGGCCV